MNVLGKGRDRMRAKPSSGRTSQPGWSTEVRTKTETACRCRGRERQADQPVCGNGLQGRRFSLKAVAFCYVGV